MKINVASLLAMQANSAFSKGKEIGVGFDKIMDQSLKSTNNLSSKVNFNNNRNGNAIDVKDQVNAERSNQELTRSDNKPMTKTATKEQTPAVKSEAPGKKSNEDITKDADLIAKISGLVQTVRDTLINLLNITPEELDQMLTQEGKSVVELFDTDFLKQMVLTTHGEQNIAAVLTDENLAIKMNQVLQVVTDLLTDADIPVTEEQFKVMLSQITSDETDLKVEPQDIVDEINIGVEKVNNTEIAKVSDDSKVQTKDIIPEEGYEIQKAVVEIKEEGFEFNSDKGKERNTESKAVHTDLNVFMNNLTMAVQNNQNEFNTGINSIQELREIANQIVDRIKVVISGDQTTMEMQLNPEHLGKVNLTISSKNGALTAQFLVQNETTKEAIESQMQTLRDTLNQQGIKVEAIEVTVSNFAFEQSNQASTNEQQNQQKDQSKNKITLEEALSMTEATEDENLRSDIMGIQGSSVEFTA